MACELVIVVGTPSELAGAIGAATGKAMPPANRSPKGRQAHYEL